MNILIKETGELRSLSFIDWHDGQEYTEQLISASGEDPNFLFDQDGEVFMTDAPTFSKWNAFFRSHYDIESPLISSFSDPKGWAPAQPFFVLISGNKLLLKVLLEAKLIPSECTIEGRTKFLVLRKTLLNLKVTLTNGH